jgi:glutamate-ammonia-ligase adenylyltransferase
LPASSYYARLCHRLIGAITAATAEGRLYAVDMRLRPSGEAGPIALSLAAFDRYQREAAWTWEHMALTRARPVAGDPLLRQRAATTIGAVLTAPRDPDRLVTDVAAMRHRIAEQNPPAGDWDVKYRRGGLIDLEFVVQYLVLREATRHPDIVHRHTEEALAALAREGLLPPSAHADFAKALSLFRAVAGLLTLLVDRTPDAGLDDAVAATLVRCAGAVDSAALAADMTGAAAAVRGWYDRLIEEPAVAVQRATGECAQ